MTEGVLDFLRDTRVGCMATLKRPTEEEGEDSEDEEQARLAIERTSPLFFPLSFLFFWAALRRRR